MTLQAVIIDGETIAAGAEFRPLPNLDVSAHDRLHLHVSAGTSSVADISVRVLFGTPHGSKILLADSTVWFEDSRSEREFSYTTPATYNGTGFVMSVPVVAPMLYDVIINNRRGKDDVELYVTLLAQEI
ncbi:MAG: hypothetical protein AAF547_22130 [Actinomycetota bacterium]